MKEYISKKTILVAIPFIALVSVSIYPVSSEFSALSSHDHSVVLDIATEDNSVEDLAILEKSHQAQLTDRDLALPPPSDENDIAEATGQYADQIDQRLIFHKAKSAGYLPPEVAPGSHPPTGRNVTAEPQGEQAHEVSQKALIDKAKSAGYLTR